MNRDKTILFDLDGTLTDPALGITKSVAYALRHYGIEVTDLRELLPYIGPPLTDSFIKFHGFTPEAAQEAVSVYREYFGVTGLFENDVYPGMHAFLQRLKDRGLRLAVATSKPTVYAVKILEHFHLDGFFEGIYGSEMNLSRMKKSEVIAYALEQLGIREPSQSCVMIGDREHDVLGAEPFGIPAIGVLYGYGDRKELENAGAYGIAENLDELEKRILSWANLD